MALQAAHRRAQGSFTPVRASARPTLGRLARRGAVRVVAFKESQAVDDWRIQKMVDVAKVFYHQVLSKRDPTIAIQQVVDDSIVFRDNIWGTAESGPAPLVGMRAFSDHLRALRAQYPDMCYDIEQMGVQDSHHLFVLWSCHETNLESFRGPASLHASIIQGVDVITFNHDRTKVVEVSQFRQPTWEERHQREAAEATPTAPCELKLARLHWEYHSGEETPSNNNTTANVGYSTNSSNGKKRH